MAATLIRVSISTRPFRECFAFLPFSTMLIKFLIYLLCLRMDGQTPDATRRFVVPQLEVVATDSACTYATGVCGPDESRFDV